MAIRIAIADEVDLTLLGAQTVLALDYRYRVVGTARSKGQLHSVLVAGQPDVIIMSTRLHDTDLFTTLEQLRSNNPRLKVIVIAGMMHGLLIRDLLEAGADAVLCRGDDLCDLLGMAVQVVMANRPFLSPTASAEYLTAMQSASPYDGFDREQRQILHLLAHGYSIDQIARLLQVDTRHIYWVRHKLRRRFGAKTNEHLIQRANSDGFIFAQD